MASTLLLITLAGALACLVTGAVKGLTFRRTVTVVALASLHFARYLGGKESGPFYDPNQ